MSTEASTLHRAGFADGLAADTASAREEFERRMEEANEESLKTLRRGGCLGGNQFRERMLEEMEGKLGDHHSGEWHRETAEARAERIIAEELARLGWTGSDLAIRRKSDPAKLVMGARLRQETTLSIKGIAARLHLGTSKSANTRLHQWMEKTKRYNAPTGAIPNQSKTPLKKMGSWTYVSNLLRSEFSSKPLFKK
ncbi:MAG: hypothetical protein O2960_21835 [Verrucomicrobia bacterium]|nr:hypothetical protein [Verrucomicrobiota bacterium]